jgi:hypothetical protein
LILVLILRQSGISPQGEQRHQENENEYLLHYFQLDKRASG